MNPKVSIIIPAYNVEQEIESSLNSIRIQTYTNLEIIVINDGSTDNTLRIVQEVAKTDQRITILTQENSGLSRTRNRGLEFSTGKYVYFFDADDVLKKSAISLLVEKIEYLDSDLVTFNADSFDVNKKTQKAYVRHEKMSAERAYTRDEFLQVNKWNLTPVWIYFFKKEFLEENRIRFIEDTLFEDNIFYIDIFYHCKTIGLVNDVLFYYQIRSNSIITSTDNNNHKLQSLQKIRELIGRKILEYKKDDKFSEFLNYRYNVAVVNIIMLGAGEKTISRLKYMFKNKLVSLFNIKYIFKQYVKSVINSSLGNGR